jgi:hypothetical protein
VRTSATLLFVTGSLILTLGCGRKATEADCQLIVDRNVEVTMRAMSNQPDQAAITKKQEELRAEMKDGLKDCVGRRVTDSMIDCVKNAKSQDAINACIR